MHTVEIKSTENGPNLVYLNSKVFTALCRCGGSSNKPVCDETHAKIGFHAKPADIKVLAEHSKVEARLEELELRYGSPSASGLAATSNASPSLHLSEMERAVTVSPEQSDDTSLAS